MIAGCPKCGARYRVDEGRIGSGGAKLRCAKCQAVFRVRAPEAGAESAPAPAEAVKPSAAPAAPAPSEQQTDPARLVLVADPEVDDGKATAAAIESWGLQSILVHDGVEAMMTIQRRLPRAVVLDAALPKMYGFQICEVIKRNDALRDTHVILVGAINDADRDRRPPGDLYGADDYLERQDLPGGLRTVLQKCGMEVGGAPSSSPSPSAADSGTALDASQLEGPTQFMEAPVSPSAAVSDDQAQAERLARIIISDVILYNQEKFEAAVRAGNVLEVMEVDMAEGRALFAQRIPEAVRQERDHLADELLRVARERGMT